MIERALGFLMSNVNLGGRKKRSVFRPGLKVSGAPPSILEWPWEVVKHFRPIMKSLEKSDAGGDYSPRSSSEQGYKFNL